MISVYKDKNNIVETDILYLLPNSMINVLNIYINDIYIGSKENISNDKRFYKFNLTNNDIKDLNTLTYRLVIKDSENDTIIKEEDISIITENSTIIVNYEKNITTKFYD